MTETLNKDDQTTLAILEDRHEERHKANEKRWDKMEEKMDKMIEVVGSIDTKIMWSVFKITSFFFGAISVTSGIIFFIAINLT